MLTLENPSDVPHINDLPFNYEGCPCGNENHKKLTQFIMCLFCGKLCHLECATAASVWVGSGVLDSTQKETFLSSWKSLFPDTTAIPRPLLCVCTRCFNLEDSELSICAANNSAYECVHGPDTTKHSVQLSSKHSCVKCNKPVHVGCCIYIHAKPLHNSYPIFWDRFPICIPCVGDHVKSTCLKDWIKKPDDVEIEVNPTTILRQYFQTFAQSMHELFYGSDSNARINFSDAQKALIENSSDFDQYMGRQKFGRDEYYLTKSDIDIFFDEPCIVSPNAAEIFVCLLSLYEPIHIYTHEHEIKSRRFISPTFFQKLLDALHGTGTDNDNVFDICEKNKDWLDAFSCIPVLFIPFMHSPVADPALVVIFENTECLIIEYTDDKAEPLLETSRREHIVTALEQFRGRKIKIETVHRRSSVFKLSRSEGSLQPNFLHVCLDMLELIKPCYATVEDFKAYFAKAEPGDGDAVFKTSFGSMIKHVRHYHSDGTIQELTRCIKKVSKMKHPRIDALKSAQERGLMKIRTLTTANQRHPSVIECLDKDTLTQFLTELISITGFILAYPNTSGDNVLWSWETERSLIKLQCLKCQDSLNQRMFLSFYRGQIPSPSAWQVWENHFLLTPGSLSKLCWEDIEAALPKRGTPTDINLKVLLLKLGAKKKLWNSPHEHLFRPLFWDANTVALLGEILFHAYHEQEVARMKEREIIVCYSDEMTLLKFEDHESEDPSGSWYPPPISPVTTTILCVAYYLQHYAVFEIKLRSKLVVVYDGMDQTPIYSGSKKIPQKVKREILADVFWSDYANKCLRRFRLIRRNEEVAIGSDLQAEAYRNGNCVCGENDMWRIQSVVFTYRDDWDKRLIRQIDSYSCGRIAVLHVKKLLGFELDIHYHKQQPRKCIPQVDKLAIGSYLPNPKEPFQCRWPRA